MQLKTLGESTTALSKLKEALQQIDTNGTVGMPRMAEENRLLAEAFSGCSMEATKMAITQSSLNQTQIEAILKQKGLKGEILETTAADLANAASVNAVAAAEKKATVSTIGFGNAVKGLGTKIKAFVAANQLLLTVAIGAAAIFAAVKIIDACTTSFDELKDKASDLRQEVDESQSSMDSTKKQLDEINQKIADINSKDGISLTDEEELKKLQEQKTELENIYEIEKARHDQKQQELEDTADEYLNKKFNSDYATETYSQKQMKNGQFVDVSYSKPKEVTKLEEMEAAYNTMVAKQKELNNLEEKYNQSFNHTDKDNKEYKKKKSELEQDRDNAKKTALDIQEEAKQQVQGLDNTSESYQKVMQASQGLSDALARLNNDWNALSDNAKKQDLFEKIKKDASGLSGKDLKEVQDYINSLSSDALNIVANLTFDQNTTLESLKDALQKAQNKANNSPVNVKINTLSEDLDSSLTKKNDLDSLYSTYEKKDGDELNLGFTDDEVASMLKEHPEYIEYLTKVGDTYKLNEHAMEQWTKANEDQNKSVQNMLGSYESMKNYSTLLNNIKAPSSHGIDEKGNIRSGLGDTKATKLESSDLDGLLDISNELNNSLAEGTISAKEYFDGISESITSSGLEQALKNVNLQFNETTDYIEEATAAISGELSDALLQSNKQFVLGQTTMSDYVGELKSGVSAEKKLIAATYNLEETEDERGELATQAMGATNDVTQKAIDSYNQLNKTEQDLDAVSPLITSLSDNADFLANYVDSYGTLMDSIMDDTQFTDYVSSLSQALVDFANSSTENLYAVQDALVQNAYVSAAQAADLVSQGSDAIAENIGGSLDAVEGLTIFSMGEVGSSIQNASTSIGNVLSALGDALSSFDYSIKAEPYISGNFGIKKDENGLPCGIDIPSFGVNIHGEGGSSISNLSASLSSAGSYFSNSGKEQLKARAMDINSYRSKGNSLFTRPSVARPSTIETMNDSSGSSGSGSDSSSEPSPQDFNWVEPLLSKISKAYDRLKNKVSDTTRTWLNRNNALSDSMETLLSEINAQSDAYDFYMDRFNSYDLDGYYKDQIANGSFNIETVYDENLKDAISDCQDLYDKAQDAADAVQSLNIEIRQLAKSRFDNIQSQFEEVLGKVNSIKDLYSKNNDLLEEQGWFASTLLNNSMIEQEQKNLEKLEQERDALTKALNSAMASGKIEAESEDWYSMQSTIDDCTSSIYDAKKALVEYDNAIRQINWDAFDRTRDDVSNLIDETQFLVDLLKDEDITDDNGNMNDNGKAAQALIAQKYQLYLNQAKAYKDEILKINEELANDPYDKELLDRKQELIKAQQEAINSSTSEKNALKDLVQEGYDTFLDKLDEVIQKYKDLMNQQKDAYDYEKSIAEKTKALNALEKQYSAVQGDNSEEGKKNIQQLKDQINTAKDDLKDTEYEKLISDTQAILDNLADTTKTWLDERLDSFDITMQEIIDQSNENASNISQTITDTAENYGYKLSESMSNIWSTNASNITNGINSVLGDFSNKFVEGNNAINKVCGDINAAVQGLLKNSNDEAQRVADEIARQQAEQNANTDGGYSDGGGSSDSGDDWSDNWDNSDSGSSDDGGGSWGDWFYHLEDDYPKDLLEIDTSIVDYTI